MKKIVWQLLLIGVFITSSVSPIHAEDLIVDLGNKFKSVNHLASCSLYGIKSPTEPTSAMIAPTKPVMFVQMAPNGGQLPNGSNVPVGDILMAAPIAANHGAQVTLRMPDVYPNFPYQWVSMDDWLSKVDKIISDWLQSGNTNLYGYELWNEPDTNWNVSAAGNFNDAWKITYDRIKSRDPNARIVGPSFANYSDAEMRDFLTFAKNTNSYPDVVSWHELEGDWLVQGHFDSYRSIENSLGMFRPVSINEYTGFAEDGQPGKMVSYISKMERNQAETACAPFWHGAGRLGNILATASEPSGAWWLYKWYGDMEGSMVYTSPPAANIDGMASINNAGNELSIIFGGYLDNRIIINNISSTNLGDNVHVYAEFTEFVGTDIVYPNPGFWFEGDFDVVNNQLILDVFGLNEFSAQRITISANSNTDNGSDNGTDTVNGTVNGTYRVVPVHSGKAIDVSSCGISDATNVQQWTWLNNDCQKWNISQVDGIYHRISPVNAPSKALDVDSISLDNGANVMLWEYWGGTNQQFRFENSGSGRWRIINRNSEKCLDIYGISTDDGASVVQWECIAGSLNQQFELIAQ